jgi:hypothetical protein
VQVNFFQETFKKIGFCVWKPHGAVADAGALAQAFKTPDHHSK